MLDFQNRAPNIKILKFHTNWDNNAYLEKYDFQQNLVYKLWDRHWIRGIKTSLEVVLDSDFESLLAMHVK